MEVVPKPCQDRFLHPILVHYIDSCTQFWFIIENKKNTVYNSQMENFKKNILKKDVDGKRLTSIFHCLFVRVKNSFLFFFRETKFFLNHCASEEKTTANDETERISLKLNQPSD